MSISNFARTVAFAALTLTALVGPLKADAAPAATPMIVTPFESLKYLPKQEGWPQIAVVKGDREREASSMIMKLGRGAFPMHTHSASYQLVVIKGVMKHWDAQGSQKTAQKMGPGSFWYQPAGQAHGDACESEECVWFITFDGPHDFKPESTNK